MTPEERAFQIFKELGNTVYHRPTIEMIAAHIHEAIAAEREACATVADKFRKDYPAQDACADIADAIRSRSKEET